MILLFLVIVNILTNYLLFMIMLLRIVQVCSMPIVRPRSVLFILAIVLKVCFYSLIFCLDKRIDKNIVFCHAGNICRAKCENHANPMCKSEKLSWLGYIIDCVQITWYCSVYKVSTSYMEPYSRKLILKSVACALAVSVLALFLN